MNLYLRYFESETLVHNVDEAIAFLSGISEIDMTDELIEEIREYAEGDNFYPKRYKVRGRIYFIMIKTEAETMQDFKDKKAVRSKSQVVAEAKANEQKRLNEQLTGWYEGSLDFKRVVVNHAGKCEYRDTLFVARCIADSQQECYERIVEHLRTRVDSRSQFPASKGKSFKCKYLGKAKSQVEELDAVAE